MGNMNMSTRPPDDRARRVFLAGMFHETNVFSPIPTGAAAFDAVFGCNPDATTLPACGTMAKILAAAGCEIFASHYAFAQPSAPPTHAVYAERRDGILRDLDEQGPFDAVLYFLHGAQMAQGEDDCEGDLMRRTRAIVGPDVVIAVELDLHANLSEAMTEAVDIMLACREYPHIDFEERAGQLAELALAALDRRIRPTTRYTRVPMMGLFHTTDCQLAALVARTKAMEGVDGVHAVSLIHGFAQANSPLVGAGVLVVAEHEVDTHALAGSLAREFFALRAESAEGRKSINDVVAALANASIDRSAGPIVVADYADNAGGGAGSDATFLLEALIAAQIADIALGVIWDPVAAAFAHDAGIGGSIKLRLGGKTGPFAGRPLDVRATVTALGEDIVQRGLGLELPLGRSAALEIDGIAVVVNSERQQVFDPSVFRDHGIDPASQRAVIVKSAQHFRAAFAPIAREILYCETPGVMNCVYRPDRFDRVLRPIWPIDADVGGAWEFDYAL